MKEGSCTSKHNYERRQALAALRLSINYKFRVPPAKEWGWEPERCSNRGAVATGKTSASPMVFPFPRYGMGLFRQTEGRQLLAAPSIAYGVPRAFFLKGIPKDPRLSGFRSYSSSFLLRAITTAEVSKDATRMPATMMPSPVLGGFTGSVVPVAGIVSPVSSVVPQSEQTLSPV